ncbi:MAG TPA: hypothetical protein VM681_00510 [Candidatus Thermoplasmatota archaeon]|nr:hypothetical protein [Candidatus Thermoplasmatota archaeon]
MRPHAVAALALATLLVAGCLETTPPPSQGADAREPPGETQVEVPRAVARHNFTGVVSGLPAAPGESAHAIEVPPGATSLVVNLAWNLPVARLALVLVDPAGASTSASAPLGPTGAHVRVLDPAPGSWTLLVRTERAVQEAYRLQARVGVGDVATNWLAGSLPVRPGLFAEVNLEMQAGRSFDFAWKTSDGSQAYFNVHVHRNGQTVNFHEGRYAEYAGSFTSEDDGGASLLWANEGALAFSVDYDVEGDFALHSVFG